MKAAIVVEDLSIFFRLLGELIVGSVYDLELKMTTLFTASA